MELSLYCKDELPTWEELYNFYLKGIYDYDYSRDTEIDPYWKRPAQLMQLMWFCNQLNKFCLEGDFDFKVQFTLGNESPNNPSIYTCKIPSTNQYSIFITNRHPRADIDNYLVGAALTMHGKGTMDEIIPQILKEVIEYYKEPIGWKGKN